ncbi:STM3941 family protein [Pedobacter sp. KLB.chiD]|uniref:STM3941 family protein n=1 Tax=Pedobacter sp. KLB.chiD TaxID=3387402 RepID=UPI00399C0DF2
MKDVIEIGFKKSNIIFSIALCLLGKVFSVFLLFQSYLPVKIICLIWMMLILIILSERILQLNQAIKEKVALKLDGEGLTNFTPIKTVCIPWNEIEGFQTGLYRTNSISIKVSNPARHKTTTIKDYVSLIAYLNDLFSSRPYLLWIDMDVLNIKKTELLAILHKRQLFIASKNQRN